MKTSEDEHQQTNDDDQADNENYACGRCEEFQHFDHLLREELNDRLDAAWPTCREAVSLLVPILQGSASPH